MWKWGVYSMIVVLLSSCGGEEGQSTQQPVSKTAHFSYSDFVTRSFSDQHTQVTISIPDCFEKDEYGGYGLNNHWMLSCYDNYSFLSIDYFTLEEIENYFYYYSDEEGDMGDPLTYLLDYMIHQRAGNLIQSEISQLTEEVNERKANFLFQSVTGRETDYQDNVFFLFGAVELDGQYFIVQSICSTDNIKFHLNDFKRMALSIKRV